MAGSPRASLSVPYAHMRSRRTKMAPVKITAIPVGPEAQAALAGKTVTAYDGMSRGDLFKLLTYGLDGAIVQGHTTTKIEDAAGAWLNRDVSAGAWARTTAPASRPTRGWWSRRP